MEDEEGYMTLSPELRTTQRRMNCTSQRKDAPQAHSRLHQIAFWVGWAGTAILLATVIALENPRCELCPLNWVSKREKCYWFSNQRKNWSEAHKHCSRRGAQMLVVRDIEEKEFILNISQGKNRLWTGLRFSTSEKKWIWVDESSLDHSVLSLSLHASEKSCGAIKDSQFHVEICMDEFEWICEKQVLSI